MGKTANITPNFRKSKKEDPGNYRSASLTSAHEKIKKQILLEAIPKPKRDKKVIRNS